MKTQVPPTTRPNLILATCCMSLLVVGMDVTIVNVALPSINRDLHASVAGLQWIMDAYTLVVASLLMLSGSVADRIGRRRVFQVGLTMFSLGSALCSLAPDIGSLIAARAAQGLGASMLNPVALSIIANAFEEEKARARAVGVWGAVAGLAFATGPILGGALTQTIGWRSIFWINLPIGVAALILTALYVPESKAAHGRGFDPVGQLLLISALASMTFAVIEGPQEGWESARIVGLVIFAIAALAGLLLYEPRRREPLVDLRFFESFPFSSSILISIFGIASFSGFLFLNALYLQQVRGFSALHTGLCTLPVAATMIACAPLSGRLVGSRGTRLPLLLSGLGLLVATVLMTRLSPSTPFPVLLTSYLFWGIALGMLHPPLANNTVAGMPLARAGVAAAILSTSAQVGAVFGVAVAGTILAANQAHGLSFASATHAVSWLMVGCSGLILLLGWGSNTPWARSTANGVAHLPED